MRAEHLEILVEEPSMEAFLMAFLPRLLNGRATFQIHTFQGKADLLGKLGARLKGYATWLPKSWRIVVVVDRDDDRCEALKHQMEDLAVTAGLRCGKNDADASWQLKNRIAVEELEAWYFGDWEAVLQAYPKVNKTVHQKEGFRDPDAIMSGTWEAFERLLQKAGYFKTGFRKIEAARKMGQKVDPERNRSRSFRAFRDVLLEAVAP